METKDHKRLDPPVRIAIHSFRRRLCDADGVSAKAAIDGLVHSGLLENDDPSNVEEVRYYQTKVKNKEDEQTIIYILKEISKKENNTK